MIQPKSLVILGAATVAAAASVHAQTAAKPAAFSDLVVQDYALAEEKPDGASGQPDWVKQRRFSNTRVYLQKDPWEMGVEQWYRVRTYDGGRVTQRSQTEFEMGLPYRMQLDIYEKAIHDNSDDRGWQQDEVAVDLRYGLADWGVLPLNPALYVEYAFAHEGSDILESKILFGDELPRNDVGVAVAVRDRPRRALQRVGPAQRAGERPGRRAPSSAVARTARAPAPGPPPACRPAGPWRRSRHSPRPR